jgi:hypothetical protein
MGAMEDAVDAAANFIGPFVEKSREEETRSDNELNTSQLIDQALAHLQAINTADIAADPNAPYDASLAGVVYGLLDLITSLGVIPNVSPGVAFSQRPSSVLTRAVTSPASRYDEVLSKLVAALLPILEQNGTGVQPLLSQRILPDIISALAELSYSPLASEEIRRLHEPVYQKILANTATSRLLPILTTFLQQPLPGWLRPIMALELSCIPLRPHGIRHTIEFLSLSYLSKNSRVPQDALGSQSQLPIPVEAITQASRLLVLPPANMDQATWLRRLAPQLWHLLDGNEGRELSRAAGQIIAGGILSKKTTGAPGMIGWKLFVAPLCKALDPFYNVSTVLVPEHDFEVAVKRLSALLSSYAQVGLFRRLMYPLLLPIWGLLTHAQRPGLDQKWQVLARGILIRYLAIAGDAKQVDTLATNLFWDGAAHYSFAPGAQGGVEIRSRSEQRDAMDDILTRIGNLDTRINLLISLLVEAKISDDVAGSIFAQASKRWLAPASLAQSSLTYEPDDDPLAALINAKMCEALASRFQDQFVRSPQHILELMQHLLENFVGEHNARVKHSESARADYRSIVNAPATRENRTPDTVDEDLISFALSTLSTLVSSPSFTQTPPTRTILAATIPPLVYLAHSLPPSHQQISHAATSLLTILQPSPQHVQTLASDPLTEHRETLKTIFADVMSPDPPARTWALTTLRTLMANSLAWPIVDVPATTHMLLSASLADPEAYVHSAAVPVVVDIALRAPGIVVGILVDAFVDVDEVALKTGRADDKDREVQQALDFRLRVGEVLDRVVVDGVQYAQVRKITDACLALASRRGQRTQTLAQRTEDARAEREGREEGEAAWGGPIPNLLETESGDAQDQAERDALLKIVRGWEDTGVEEDVRIRTSALSILSSALSGNRAHQATVDAALQLVLLILTMETSEAKGILRRAAVYVVLNLLRSLNGELGNGKDAAIHVTMKQQEEVERVMRWLRDEDCDRDVRDYVGSVFWEFETLRRNQLLQIRDEGLQLGPNLELEGKLRGLDVKPHLDSGGKRKMMVEEVE